MLIVCPECGKEISDKSKVCIHCGCPITSENKNENVQRDVGSIIPEPNCFYAYCPRCLDNATINLNYDSSSIVCENCHDFNNPSYKTISYTLTNLKPTENQNEFISLLREIESDKHNENFNEESYKYRNKKKKYNILEQMRLKTTMEVKHVETKEEFEDRGLESLKKVLNPVNIKYSYNSNIPKCPICGSTNLKRISSTEKVTNVALFGLFGNKRKHQWHCNSCKSDF